MMRIDPLKIVSIKVVETIKEGNTVYLRSAAPKQAAAPSRCADSEACYKMASHALNDAGVIEVHLHGN